MTRPDGTPAGWLIATGDHFTEVSELGEALASLARDRRGRDDLPRLAIPHQR